MFVVLKFPLIPRAKVEKYLLSEIDETDPDPERWSTYRRRLWQVRWEDLPAGAKTKLASTGELTVKATAAYVGAFDYTWAQVKSFFRNLKTGLDETEDL